MKKFIAVFLLVLLISGCSAENLTLKGDIQNNIISLNSTVSGKIVQMNKEQGEMVKKGDLVAVIDNVNQKYAVDQLQAVVDMKKSKLEELQAGTRPQQIEQAESQARAAKAQLDLLVSGTRPEQIEQAEAQVRAAKAQLDLMTSGNRTEQIEQAKYAALTAQTAYDSAKTTYNFKNSEYQKALKLYESGAISKKELDAAKYQSDIAAEQVSTAKYQVETANKQLELLQNGSTKQAIEAARANYDAANAQLKLLKNGSTRQSIEAARANYDAANAQLKLLKNGSTRQSIEAARANYDAANAQLKLLRSGATVQAIAAAQADLDQSAAQLNQAKNILNNYNIVAVTDGILISRNYQLGDIVNIGSNIADIAVSNDIYVLCYIPDKYLDKIYYNQSITVKTSAGTQTGRISYIALKHEYTPKDKQSTSDSKHTATKIKVAINNNRGVLKSGMTASVLVPLK